MGNGITDTLDDTVLTKTKDDLVDGKWAIEAPEFTGYTALIDSKNVTFVEGTDSYEVSFTYTVDGQN